MVLIGDRGMWTGTAVRPGATAPAPDEPWTTGSIGKTITAAEVMRVAERGRVELDAPAASLFQPGVGLDTNGATVRDLLRMRSGLTQHDPPGTVWEYTNRDYELLGRVIEGVEGRPFGNVLTSDVLDVPGVTGLRLPEHGSVANAAGPLDADPVALARWGYALFGGDVVVADSLRQMVTFDENTYGMGVFDFSADFNMAAAGHLGIDELDSAAMVGFPDDAMVIVTMGKGATWEQSYGALQDLRAVLRVYESGDDRIPVERKTLATSLGVPLGWPLRSGGQAPEADALSTELQARGADHTAHARIDLRLLD